MPTYVQPSTAAFPNRPGLMLILRFFFKSVVLWLLGKVLGRFLPILRRILRLVR